VVSRIALVVTAVSSLVFSGCTSRSSQRSVNLGIWSNYLSSAKIAEFEKKTGIHVETSLYASNEELLAKLQSGGSTFDVVVPSDYMISTLSKLKLLKPLDLSKLPNAKSLDPRFLKRDFDPQNQYSLPYDWGTTGISVNRALYKGEIRGWNDLFTKPDLAGQYAMIDDVRETIGAALKSLGYSLNSTNPKELAQAKDLLLKTRKRIKSFTSEPIVSMSSGEVAVSHNYSSNSLQIAKNLSKPVDYIYPVEGGTLWIDNLAIPANAPHVAEAHELINFLLEPQTALATLQSVFVTPANRDAYPLLPPDLRQNRTLFPTEQDLAHFEMIQDLGDGLLLWDKIWTEVKASED
jgi:spermidine/putrescine transport system substrate-binding protein